MILFIIALMLFLSLTIFAIYTSKKIRTIILNGKKFYTIRCGGFFPFTENNELGTHFTIPFIRFSYNESIINIKYPDFTFEFKYEHILELINYKNEIKFKIRHKDIKAFRIYSPKAKFLTRYVEKVRSRQWINKKNYCAQCNKIINEGDRCNTCGKELTFIQ